MTKSNEKTQKNTTSKKKNGYLQKDGDHVGQKVDDGVVASVLCQLRHHLDGGQVHRVVGRLNHRKQNMDRAVRRDETRQQHCTLLRSTSHLGKNNRLAEVSWDSGPAAWTSLEFTLAVEGEGDNDNGK